MLVNMNFWQAKMFHKKKDLLEKNDALKRFEHSPLRSELKKQTSIVEKQYQGLNMLFKSDKKKEERVTTKKEKTTIISESKLTYGSRYSFSDNKNVKKYSGLSFTTKYDKLL